MTRADLREATFIAKSRPLTYPPSRRKMDMMKHIRDEIRKKLGTLITEGTKILFPESQKQKEKKTKQDTPQHPPSIDYQSWYTKALPVVKQLIPERYKEFQELYKLEKRDNKIITSLTYTISDYLLGLRITKNDPDDPFGGKQVEIFSSQNAYSSKFYQQITILKSAKERLDSILADIEGVLQAELFDSELDAATELLKKKHLRAAGALAGVTLEAHLSKVLANHNLKLAKKNPTIADYNDTLKNNDVYDIDVWRPIQRLGDIRNYCVHRKDREPRKDEVQELIDGVLKIIKTIF